MPRFSRTQASSCCQNVVVLAQRIALPLVRQQQPLQVRDAPRKRCRTCRTLPAPANWPWATRPPRWARARPLASVHLQAQPLILCQTSTDSAPDRSASRASASPPPSSRPDSRTSLRRGCSVAISSELFARDHQNGLLAIDPGFQNRRRRIAPCSASPDHYRAAPGLPWAGRRPCGAAAAAVLPPRARWRCGRCRLWRRRANCWGRPWRNRRRGRSCRLCGSRRRGAGGFASPAACGFSAAASEDGPEPRQAYRPGADDRVCFSSESLVMGTGWSANAPPEARSADRQTPEHTRADPFNANRSF